MTIIITITKIFRSSHLDVLLCVLILMLMSNNAFAQLNVNATLSPQQLVENVFIGGGVEVSNVTLGAQTLVAQLGEFSNSNTNLGISNGIMLSTGYATDAAIAGTNTNTSFSSQGAGCSGGTSGLCLAGDADLDAILGISTKDAAVLEFDFVPLSDTVRFRYVFASEEYNEYTCSQYNDVFAFLLSGPGMATQNIALIPNTNTAVAINTINSGSVGLFGSVNNCNAPNGSLNYSNYFVDNSVGSFVQFDGMTRVLEAIAVVQPCQTYHIKLAVADANDGALDSGVFLEAGSFSADVLNVAANTPDNNGILTEGCNSGSVTLSFDEPVQVAQSINYTILGTATNGIDYQNLSGTATIPIGQSQTTIDIIPIADNVYENNESITLLIHASACQTDTVNIQLSDELILDRPLLICDTANAVSATVSWLPVSGATGYQISTDGGNTWQALSNSITQYTLYGLSPNSNVQFLLQPLGGSTLCSQQPIDTIICNTIICTLTAQLIQTSNVTCFGGNDGSATVIAMSGKAPLQYILDNDINTLQATPFFQNLAAGTHTITIIDADSCEAVVNFSLSEPPAIQVQIDTIMGTSCSYASDGIAQFSASNGAGSYVFEWNGNANSTGFFDSLSVGNQILKVTDADGCSVVYHFVVPSPAPIQVTDSIIPVRCYGGSDGQAHISASGGVATDDYLYQWDNGITTNNMTNVAAGSYILTVTDDNQCEAVTTITITEPSPISLLNSLMDSVSCARGNDGNIQTAFIGGTGSYSYEWSNGITTANNMQIAAGEYSLTITDANACKDTFGFTVAEPLPFEINNIQLENVSCFGASNGQASVMTSQTALSYLWLPSGNTSSMVTNLSAGQHSIVVTNAKGCTATDTFMIDQPAPIQSIIQEINGASCYRASDGQARILASGGTPFINGSPYLYQWSTSPTQNQPIATQLRGGNTYSVVITDSLGCVATNQLTISQPNPLIANIITEDVSCHNGSDGALMGVPSGGTPSYHYSWSNGMTAQNIAGLAEGIYELTVTDVNNCTTTASATIGSPDPLALLLIAEDVLCKGENTGKIQALVSGGTPQYDFLWNNAAEFSLVNHLSAGQYAVTATDANNCLIADSITIREPAEILTADMYREDVSCADGRDGRLEADVRGGVPPYEGSINNEAFSNALAWAGLTGNDYQIRIRDDNGCTWDSSVTIVAPDPIILDAGDDVLMNWDETRQLMPSIENAASPIRYLWQPFEGLSCTDCAKPIAQPTQNTIYTLTVTDINGCSASDRIAVRLLREYQIFVATAFTPNGDGVNDQLFVQSELDNVLTIRQFDVFDRWGELLFSANNTIPNEPALGWSGTNGSRLMPAGVYAWSLVVEFSDGTIKPFKGHSTLIR